MSAVQLDLFEVSDAERKEERLKERSKVMVAAIRKIDPAIKVVAVFCDIVHSFIVKEEGKYNLYIFDDYEKLDSFRYDRWSFKEIPEHFIKVE